MPLNPRNSLPEHTYLTPVGVQKPQAIRHHGAQQHFDIDVWTCTALLGPFLLSTRRRENLSGTLERSDFRVTSRQPVAVTWCPVTFDLGISYLRDSRSDSTRCRMFVKITRLFVSNLTLKCVSGVCINRQVCYLQGIGEHKA
ncbi:hypothetical protein AVEN_180299-1 [Araneus ventricosus]|uniref:Uncharacterized protein n=1 Tax=Araneus ventricosus TaxID=182803 RepID=A0A4Y2UF37_ARAVE|nr:hypothetical protein AVEN_180299-1 [Araneus ventricosus]